MLARNAVLLNRITRDYLRAMQSLRVEIAALQDAVQMGEIGPGGIVQLAAMQSLLAGVRREVQKFAGQLAENIEEAIRLEIEMAGIDGLGMVQAALPGMEPAQLNLAWAQLNTEAVYTMFGFTDPAGPLFASITHKFSQAVAEQVREILLTGFMQGMGPGEIARLIQRATGLGLSWALNTARTAAIWAYRAAAHQTYLNNSDVVQAWMWFATLDERVCMSCVSQHGSVHLLSEILMDHHSGRCTPIPVTRSYADLGIEGMEETPLQVQRGEEWFKGLDEAQQRKMMGGAMWRAWQDGAITFEQLSKPYIDPVYGTMLREASLKEILGERAKLYYA